MTTTRESRFWRQVLDTACERGLLSTDAVEMVLKVWESNPSHSPIVYLTQWGLIDAAGAEALEACKEEAARATEAIAAQRIAAQRIAAQRLPGAARGSHASQASRKAGETPTPETRHADDTAPCAPHAPADTALLDACRQFAGGRLRFGPYRLVRLLGAGVTGAVFLGRHRDLGHVVAVKVLQATRNANARVRFQREMAALQQLEHESIAAVELVGEESGIPYLALEFLDGRTLRELLDRGPIGAPAAVATALAVAGALQTAHARGVLHRDVKPENIIITYERRVVLVDFGLAKPLDDGGLTRQGTVLGTFGYMAPEAFTGSDMAMASDQYSLAATLYEALAGRKTVDARRFQDLMKQIVLKPPPPPPVDNALAAVVMRALEKVPQDRYPSVAAFAAALTDWLSGQAPELRQPPLPERSPEGA